MTVFSTGTQQQPHKRLLWLAVACIVAGCATPPPPPAPVVVAPPPPAPVAVIVAPPAPPPAPVVLPSHVSHAITPKDYRRDAATHLYGKVSERIYKGKMPPLLHAVGVLQVDIDRSGGVTDVRWMRAPKHAPSVMAEIERTVRAAAPYPAPIRMERVTYTDTWLWHKTGHFQLDTLSEGQR
ncbi:MAG: hypothetical protein QE279_08935 [Rhodoferax sp.]|nr:hypothetical protein [Rhodoferax sp.]